MQAQHARRDGPSASLAKPAPEDYIKLRPASEFLYEGEKRILLEMETIEGVKVYSMLRRYADLVESLAKAIDIERKAGDNQGDSESFIAGLVTVFKEQELRGAPDGGVFLMESIQGGGFDCDISSWASKRWMQKASRGRWRP